jgi:hypothetical protein
MSDDDIEQKARTLYEAQSSIWTGHVWDWNEANEYIKDIWRKLAHEATCLPTQD